MPTPAMSQEETLEYIKDILPAVYTCIHSGHAKYDQRNSDHAHELSTTTRANIIRDYVVYNAKQEFSENLRVRFMTVQRMLLMVVGDKVAIRFKKLTNKRQSVNVLTRQVKEWRSGMFTMPIPGLEAQKLTCIDIGYINDAIGAGIKAVWAVALGEDPWFFNMTEGLGGIIIPTLFSSEEELPDEVPFVVNKHAKTKRNEKQAGI